MKALHLPETKRKEDVYLKKIVNWASRLTKKRASPTTLVRPNRRQRLGDEDSAVSSTFQAGGLLSSKRKVSTNTIDLTGENTVADDLDLSFTATIPKSSKTIEKGGPYVIDRLSPSLPHVVPVGQEHLVQEHEDAIQQVVPEGRGEDEMKVDREFGISVPTK